MKEQISKQRSEWTRLARGITEKLLERNERIEHDLAPGSLLDDDDRRNALKFICRMNRDINSLCEKMSALERTTKVGTKALLNRNPEHLMRIVVALLATARFDRQAEREARCVGDIVEIVGAKDSDDCLAVRSMFRDDSVLRPHLSISYRQTLDASSVCLKESSLNKLLAQKTDQSEKVTDAISMVNKWN